MTIKSLPINVFDRKKFGKGGDKFLLGQFLYVIRVLYRPGFFRNDLVGSADDKRPIRLQYALQLRKHGALVRNVLNGFKRDRYVELPAFERNGFFEINLHKFNLGIVRLPPRKGMLATIRPHDPRRFFPEEVRSITTATGSIKNNIGWFYKIKRERIPH